MIDVRELQRQGRLRFAKPGHEPATNSEGFVEISPSSRDPQPIRTPSTAQSSINPTGSSPTTTGDGFFSFMDNPASSSPMEPSSTGSENSIELRRISRQISDLDNKLYKMEQRIELLERKAGVGN